MIETLNGLFETVNYKKDTTLKLYDNDKYEDYPNHWHPAMEIIMPVENGYKLFFSGTEVDLKEGDICVICPGCIHAIAAPKKGRRFIFQPNASFLKNMRDTELLISYMSPYLVITPEEYPQIYKRLNEIMFEIRDEYMEGLSFAEVSIYSKFFEMIVLIGKSLSQKKKTPGNNPIVAGEEYASVILNICDYIKDHCSEDLKLNDIADMSGFSKYYFERLFKQYTGTSFYKYVNQKRIYKAQELLSDPGNTVTDVAINCGFTSISSFIRMFKLQKGCTPSKFKSLNWGHPDVP